MQRCYKSEIILCKAVIIDGLAEPTRLQACDRDGRIYNALEAASTCTYDFDCAVLPILSRDHLAFIFILRVKARGLIIEALVLVGSVDDVQQLVGEKLFRLHYVLTASLERLYLRHSLVSKSMFNF